MDVKAVEGQWGPLFNLKNVGIHVHLLPTGKVLYWGRRENPGDPRYHTLNEHKTKTFILDVDTCESRPTATEPKNEDDMPVNLFCAGHTFLPDGRLIIFGGHVLDGFGEDQACIYNPFNDTFTPIPSMVQGRWYPTAIALADGRALVVSGSSQDVSNAVINLVPQAFNPEKSEYGIMSIPTKNIFSLYPRLFHAPKGKIFMAGPMAKSRWLDLNLNNGKGEWSSDDDSIDRPANQREYAASAMYDSGKVVWVSGGSGGDKGDDPYPTKVSSIVDLNAKTPKWEEIAKPKYGRRHHFATTLPDGTVLVTAGTQGVGFNDLSPGMGVHRAEIWDPETNTWSTMAAEDDDRGYHHTALLLPDGRVLSAGGGEWDPDNKHIPNDASHTKISAQIFSPPYLFRGKQPIIINAPSAIDFKKEFEVTVGKGVMIKKVSLIRLGTVTHCHNHNQSFQFLKFTQVAASVSIQGPEDSWMAPPGHYMLFLVDGRGVPSKAPIVLLKPDFGSAPVLQPLPPTMKTLSLGLEAEAGMTNEMRNVKVIQEQNRAPVIVGLVPVCPYGLGPCWGGAYEALDSLDDIQEVRPVPDGANSLAFVYLERDIVPDIDDWQSEINKKGGGTYKLRGIAMTLTGVVTKSDNKLVLAGTKTRPDLVLNRFQTSSNLLWDKMTRTPLPATFDETLAWEQIFTKVEKSPKGLTLQVTGTLQKSKDKEYSLDVRGFVEE